MTVALFGRDAGGANTFAPQFATAAYQATLAANTVTTLVVPKSQNTNSPYLLCVISPALGQEVWVSHSGTATIPATGSFVACVSEMNPPARLVEQGATLSFKAPVSINVGVSFFEPQGPY